MALRAQDDLQQGTFLMYIIEGSCQGTSRILTSKTETSYVKLSPTCLSFPHAVITLIPQLPFSAGYLRASTVGRSFTYVIFLFYHHLAFNSLYFADEEIETQRLRSLLTFT